ncbi:MAG TPA: hypothetical protein VFK51_05690 [Burkholderiales bacterium]|nr:hypothetical protein [Burkholderiales bacterium]
MAILLAVAFLLPLQGAAMAAGVACPHEASSMVPTDGVTHASVSHTKHGAHHTGTQSQECALCNLCAVCTAAYVPNTPTVARDTDYHPVMLPDFEVSFVSFISASFYRPPVAFLA